MSPLQRFIQKHLRPYLWGTLGGGLVLALGSSLQALSIGLLSLVFDRQLGLNNIASPVKPLKAFALRFAESLPLPHSELGDFSLWLLPLALLTIFVLRAIFLYLGSLWVARSGLRAVRDIRERLFDRVLIQDPVFFQRHPVGELMNRVLGDVNAIQQLASNQTSDFIKQVATALSTLVAIFLVDWHMPLVVLLLFPLVYFPIRLISAKIRSRGRENQKSADRLLARLKEVLSNMRVVKVFAREQYESMRFKSQGEELYRINMKMVRSQLLAPPMMEIVGGLLLALLVIYGGVRIREGVLSGGDFIGLLLLIYALYDPIRHLTKMYAEVQVSQVALERIFNLYDLEPTIQGPTQPKPVPVTPILIEFDQVCFAYEQGQPVIEGVSLKIQKGEIVAFVGPSGGGKSTLVNLLPRLFDPLEGRVLIDGTDIKEFDPKELRSRIGVVTQETLLFMDTIHDNIAYGLNVSRAEVMEAARRAHAHDFIAQLPQGYETRLAETGSSLSGGQRQRIAIARALLQNPPVLILDEATSALDTESESIVQQALDELIKERTTLVIAHRLSTIQRANRIYVISRGRLIEQGTHESLLAAQGEYARLHSFSVL